MSPRPLHLTAAEGRIYISPEEAETDWNNGRRFQVISGPYCSKYDANKILDLGFNEVWIEYGKGETCCIPLAY